MTLKVCFKCGLQKSIEDFYVHPRMADGRLGKCKECTKIDVRNRPKALTRAYDRRRAQTPERRAALLRQQSRQRAAHPEKFRARSAVSSAIRRGALARQPCRDCGSTVDVEGHHPDYSKPLDVVWLCDPCHHTEHQRSQQPF